MPSTHANNQADEPLIPIEQVWAEAARFKGIAQRRLAERAAAADLVVPALPPAQLAGEPKSA